MISGWRLKGAEKLGSTARAIDGPGRTPAGDAGRRSPYDYKDFEGLIPKGNMAAVRSSSGTRAGMSQLPEEKLKDKAAKEHWMMSNYYKNALKDHLTRTTSSRAILS
jgi:hypothetical protein